jgi:rod shape-determining protein MreC
LERYDRINGWCSLMADFIRRHSLLLTTALLLIASFQLMSASIKHAELPRYGGEVLHRVLSPFQLMHSRSLESINHVWQRYIWLIHAQEERDEMALRLKHLEAQNSRLLEYQSENERLGSLLNFSQQTGLNGVAATVIGRDASNWIRTITVDRGTEHGVQVGQPVVDGEAIVGQTTVATNESAKVLLLTDQSSAIDSIVQRSRATGVIEGTGGSILKMRYVLKEASVQPGDRIIASGLGGVFLKGTLIGVVTSVVTPQGGLFHEVLVKPSMDQRRLENVLVVTDDVPKPLLKQQEAEQKALPEQG